MKKTIYSILLIITTAFLLSGCDKDGPGSIELTNLSNTILPIILYEVVEDGDDIRVDGGFSLLHDQVHTWEKLAAGTKMYLQTAYAANSGRTNFKSDVFTIKSNRVVHIEARATRFRIL